MKRGLALALCFALVLAGCAQPTQNGGQAEAGGGEASPPTEILVSAAASLTDVLQEIQPLFEADSPGIKLAFNFGSSGTLQTQIEEGAPADVFLSAAQKQMDALGEGGLLLEGTRKDLLENRLVLIRGQGAAADLASFEDVATGKAKTVALGEASVPCGQYAEEVFTYLSIWDAVKAKAVFGADVRAVLSWVESGDADCGVVYKTDAATSELASIVCEAPEGSLQPVVYPGAVVASSQNQEQAKAFLDYLSSPKAAAAFEKAGFGLAQ
jgi:molybdate transport system substrate-binding protein